jgi:hypothetical protein
MAQVGDTPRLNYANDGNASRPPPCRPTLHSVTSVPLRAPGRRTAVEAQMCAPPTGCGRGSAPYRRTPPKADAPEHLLDRNADAGRNEDQVRDTPRLKQGTLSVRPTRTPDRPAGKNPIPPRCNY